MKRKVRVLASFTLCVFAAGILAETFPAGQDWTNVRIGAYGLRGEDNSFADCFCGNLEMEPLKLTQQFSELFGVRPTIFSAPGRVNLIGEHTD
jgi:hypothetical protein